MRKSAFYSVLSLAAVVLLAAACGGGEEPAQQAAPAAAPASGSGSIQGVATYANGDPDAVIAMDADPVCSGLHKDEAVHTEKVVHDGAGNLANVFVYVKEGLSGSYPVPSDPKVLDQKGCKYSPHVSGVMVGQQLIIRNSDPTLHNVHALPAVNKEFNMGQPFEGMELPHKFDKAEVMVRFKCDVHPWMSSYMGVVPHPYYAVSSTDGSYSIANLPAGDYVVEAWHEEFGTKTQNVTVGDGPVEVSFDFSPTAG